MSDLTISLDSSLIDKLFNTLSYPWRKRIEPSFTSGLSADESDDGDITIDMLGQGGEDETSGEDETFVDGLIDIYMQHARDGGNRGSSEQSLIDLIQPYAGPATGDGRALSDVRAAMQRDPAIGDRMETFLRTVDKGVELEWIEFEL